MNQAKIVLVLHRGSDALKLSHIATDAENVLTFNGHATVLVRPLAAPISCALQLRRSVELGPIHVFRSRGYFGRNCDLP